VEERCIKNNKEGGDTISPLFLFDRSHFYVIIKYISSSVAIVNTVAIGERVIDEGK
jgi:hypothetical protein